jgi:hypothetical protein
MPLPSSWQRSVTNMVRTPDSEEASTAADRAATPYGTPNEPAPQAAERRVYAPLPAPSERYRDFPSVTSPAPTTTRDARRDRFAETVRHRGMGPTENARAGTPFEEARTYRRNDQQQQQMPQQPRLNSLTPPSPREPNHAPVHSAAQDANPARRMQLPDMHELTLTLLSKPSFMHQPSSNHFRVHTPSSTGQVATSPKHTLHYPPSAHPRHSATSSLPQPVSQLPLEGQTSAQRSEQDIDSGQHPSMSRMPRDHQVPLTASEANAGVNYREEDQSQRQPAAPQGPLRLVEKRKADIAPPPGSAVAAYSSLLTPFIYKLYCLVSDKATDELCHWSFDGDSFVVPDPTRFAATVLPLYFKHNQFPSFVRQLNKYRFHKLMPGTFVFGHPKFLRDRPALLPDIVRQRSPERVSHDMQNSADVGSDFFGDADDAGNTKNNFVDPNLSHAREPASYYTSSMSLNQNILGTSDAEPGMKRRRFSVPVGLVGQRVIPPSKEQGFNRDESTHDDDYGHAAPDQATRGRQETSLLGSSSRLRAQVDRLLGERANLHSRVASLEDQVESMSHRISELENFIHRSGHS